MPRSATGPTEAAAARRAGFSLIEILVVLAIIAALAGAVAIAFPDLGGRRADNEAARLHGLLDLACERAGMTGRDVGVGLARQSLHFGHLGPGGFEPIAAGSAEPLRPRVLGQDHRLALSVDGRPVELPAQLPARPQLACLASGERVPFEIVLWHGQRRAWRLSAGVSGRIQRERIDAF